MNNENEWGVFGVQDADKLRLPEMANLKAVLEVWNNCSPLLTCLACGGSDLFGFLDLGAQPLANSYHRGETPQPRYPLAVAYCPRCTHTQLTHAVPADAMFKEYAYVSGTSTEMRDSFKSFAEAEVEEFKWRQDSNPEARNLSTLEFLPPPRVLDIACNDGTLMDAFLKAGAVDVMGVDPAENVAKLAALKGLQVLNAYWTEDVARMLCGNTSSFDIMTAFNVLAHVPDPLSFLRACVHALVPGGRVIIQTSQAHWLARGEFDYWYHEHLSGFTEESLGTLARRAGLIVESHTYPAIHGTSRRTVLRAPYHDVSLRAKETAVALSTSLQSLREAGYAVIGFGAAAKGMTLLNFAKLDLDFIIDDAPLKQGLLTPGRDIPIRGMEAMPPGPVAVLLLAWNFAEGAMKRIRAVNPSAVFVLPFPTVKVVYP